MPEERPNGLTAASFLEQLTALANPKDAADLQRYFKTGPGEYGEGDTFIGVRMGSVFALGKANLGMPIDELELLLESPIHEARAGALTIMNEEAKKKRTPDERRKELFDSSSLNPPWWQRGVSACIAGLELLAACWRP